MTLASPRDMASEVLALSRRLSARLFPHEILFGVFFGYVFLRLLLAEGPLGANTLLYLGMIATNILLIGWCLKHETPWRLRLRFMFYPIVANVIYFSLRYAAPVINPRNYDELLWQLDMALVGNSLNEALTAVNSPVLTEIMSLCYVLFYPYLWFGMIWYLCGPLETLKKFYIGLFSIQAIGFLCHILLPAAGPVLVETGASAALQTGGWLTHWLYEGSFLACNRADVFPSLHCALTCYILFFERTRSPFRYRLLILPCIGMWISTFYLGFHYFVDVICGLALAGGCLFVMRSKTAAPERLALPDTDVVSA